MKIITSLEKLSKPVLATVGFALIVAVGVVDFLTGIEIAFSLFYLVPISLVTWCQASGLGLRPLSPALLLGISWISRQDVFTHPLPFVIGTPA